MILYGRSLARQLLTPISLLVPNHRMCMCPTLLQNADPDQPVMIYCTGGIRCDVYGTYLRQKG